MTTLAKALHEATAYWDTKGPSSRMLPIRARGCIERAGFPGSLKLSTLTPTHGTQVLSALQAARLSKSSVSAYYAAFKRMLGLAGVDTYNWPKPGSPPRRLRDPLPEEALSTVTQALSFKDQHETADLIAVLNGTGMRVDVEALDWDAWKLGEDRNGFPLVRVVGKGGHERIIPIHTGTADLMANRDRMNRMRVLSYGAHLKRFNKVIADMEVGSKLPTFHAIRHLYATRAYHKSGRNIVAVQELLGHADINTTRRYIGVSVEDLRSAI